MGMRTRNSCTSWGSRKPRATSRAPVILALMLEQLMQLRRALPEAAGMSASASAFCARTSHALSSQVPDIPWASHVQTGSRSIMGV